MERRALEGAGPVGFGGDGFRWAPPRRADFHSWLFSLRRGLQPLGMSLRPGRETDAPYGADMWNPTAWGGWQGREIEPMPVVI